MTQVSRKLASIVLVLPLMLSGCASYGPTKEANYAQIIRTALPPESGAVKMSSEGTWYRDTDGWHINFASPYYPTIGIIVITETALYFLQWHKETSEYEIKLRIKYDEIQSLQLVKKGFTQHGQRISIRRKDSSFISSFNSFDFGNQKPEEVFKLLEEMKKASTPATTP